MSDSKKQVLGYACINMGFSERPKKQRITTNRTMIKRTFKDRGLAYASELALQNAKDLKKILEWNRSLRFALAVCTLKNKLDRIFK